jgi:branched-chain amino acid transport system ATP-binding protein
MLELRNVNSFYGDAQILFDVSLRIDKGEVAALFGRNGVGKTTTFRTIMGLNPPRYQGDIFYQQENIQGLPAFRIARKGIGFVPEDRQIFQSHGPTQPDRGPEDIEGSKKEMGSGAGL